MKINKSYPGQAYKVANAFWGAGQMMFNKIMVIVSSNIDIRNPQADAEEITIHFKPESDMYIGRGPLDVLDHASVKAGVGGKMLIDATEKMPEEAETITPVPLPDAALLAKAFNEFPEAEYSLNTSLLLRGISALIVAVDKSRGISAKQFASQLAAVSKELLPKIILYVDHELNPEDIPRVCWYATANIDPARDCFYVDADNIRLPCLMIDGTRKSFPMDPFNRPWPNIVVSDEDTIGPLMQNGKVLILVNLSNRRQEAYFSWAPKRSCDEIGCFCDFLLFCPRHEKVAGHLSLSLLFIFIRL